MVSRNDTKTAAARSLPIRWLLIGCIFCISAVAYVDRVNISIAAKPLAAAFHLSNIQLGWVFSAFVLGYAAFQAPAGRLADAAGPRRILTFGVIWWAVFTVLITVIPGGNAWSLMLLILVRFGLGLGEAVVYPASNCIVARWIPASERGIANGIIFSGVGFGAGITPPLITALVLRWGWQSAFWCSAALGLVVGCAWFLLARDTPREHPLITLRERMLIESSVPASPTAERGDYLSWRRIFTEPNILGVTFSYFAYGYAAYIFFSWLFIYLSEVRGVKMQESAYLTMLPLLAMAVGSPLGGWISDGWTRKSGAYAGRCGIAAIGMGLAAVFIAAGTQVASPRVASVVLALGAGSLYISQSSFWSFSAGVGKSSAGAVSGVMNMGGQIGGALTASASPFIASRVGWTWSFLVAAILCGVGAVVWLRVNPEPNVLDGR